MGIQYVLCNKLRQFPYEDIEFFLPQLCHVIITVNNESMALEEFLLDLCEESVTAALLVSARPLRIIADVLSESNALVGRLTRRASPLDFLDLSDVPARPLREPPERVLPDLSQSLQQGPAHRLRPS